MALGIGAAMAGGAGLAHADDQTGNDPAKVHGSVQNSAADSSAGHPVAGATERSTSSDGVKHRWSRSSQRQKNDGSGDDETEDTETSSAAPEGAAPEQPSAPEADAAGGGSDRRQNPDSVLRRVRTLAKDTASASYESVATDDKTSAGDATAARRTDGSTLVRGTAQSRVPAAVSTKFTPVPSSVPLAAPSAPTIRTVISGLLAAVGINPASGAGTGDVPTAPMPLVLGVLQVIRREIETSFRNQGEGASEAVVERSLVQSAASAAAVVPAVPQPTDEVATPYGNVGLWMLKSNGQVSDYGGATSEGKALYEPVNVIIVDPTSTTREESIAKLNAAMKAAGFPAATPHTTGFRGLIDGVVYGQQPTGFLQAFTSDGTPQDHGRIFGPAPAANGHGFVWTGAFSAQGESHEYLSFDLARDDLAGALVTSGAATRLADVALGNGGITGDHDGSAVVLQLNPSPPNTAPTATVTQKNPSTYSGKVTGKVTAVDAEGDKLAYTGMTTAKGTVTVTSTGSFTYTPTAAARHAAAANTATVTDKTDEFSITVNDGKGNLTTVPVTVTVVPKNTTPSSPKAAVNKANPLSGTVTGSITATDADGDVLTYTATNPSRGTVLINQDGTFTYLPSEAARLQARATSGSDTDTFTVTVDDGHGAVKTVTVKAAIAPTDQAPVAGALELGAPASNGKIKGSLAASDPDGDDIKFSGSVKTAKGSAKVSSNGTFSYTPTSAARRAAASPTATPADKIDTFTITVTDEYGATATQTVTVTILG